VGARSLVRKVKSEVVSYGTEDKQAHLRATHIENRGRGSRFAVVDHGEEIGEVMLGVPGVHNVRNALGAIAAAQYAGATFEAAQRALPKFTGVGRRFQELGRARNIVIVDDYAHHPTEIRASIAAARGAYAGRRVVAVFQPHLYSRTRDFAADFGHALAGADKVWVTNVYAAREAPIAGVTGEMISMHAGPNVTYVESLSELKDSLLPELKTGDVCVFMGAGNIDAIAHDILATLKGAV
jgi:UDP-N-acetylmuramate--alanine ligase